MDTNRKVWFVTGRYLNLLIVLLALFAATVANVQTQTGTPKKMLVTYFTSPERDGVDASTGARPWCFSVPTEEAASLNRFRPLRSWKRMPK